MESDLPSTMEAQTVSGSMQDGNFRLVFLSFISFHLLYWLFRLAFPVVSVTYVNLERDKKSYWCASAVSSVHSLVLTYFAMKVVFEDPQLFTSEDIFYKSPRSKSVMGLFIGYVLSDMLLALYYRGRWWGWIENMVHHLTLLVVWLMFYMNDYGHFFASMAHFCEITTPFINQRWFLYESNMKAGRFYKYNGLAMTLLWFITRILLYSYLGWLMIKTSSQWYALGLLQFSVIWFCYIAGFWLQYFWFYKIMKGALKSLRAKATEIVEKKLK